MMLENKSELTSSAELAREEERISKNKAAELFDRNLLDSFPAGKLATLQAIHTKRITLLNASLSTNKFRRDDFTTSR